MGLIDLKTNLKSLSYGSDQRGGGSSNQPYITTPIPDGFAPTSPDFLLRNGYLNTVSSTQDVSRLTKLFTDTKSPNGLQFIVKQELLERQNVEIPGGFNRIYNPLGTLAQAGLVSVGEHVNKQGFNFLQRGYFNGGQNGYYKTTIKDNELDINRLYGLYKIKQINSKSNQPETFLLSSTYNISTNPNYLFSYSGGPGSFLGVGKTNIRIIGNGYGNSSERTNNDINIASSGIIYSNFGNTSGFDIAPPEPQLKQGKSTLLSALNKTYNPQIDVFNREEKYATSATNYTLRRGNPNSLQTEGSDKQNLLGITDSGDALNTDLVKFYFEIINNNYSLTNVANSYLFFRAYINNLGDNFKADWQSYKYVGRAENFYKYNGFARDISLSFTIYAHSRAEMKPIYQKLNYLVSTTAPDYSEAGLMRGNLVRLTVGDYLDNVPGIINGINLKPSLEAGWDLNRKENGDVIVDNTDPDNLDVGQLPRMIEVDLTFTPIHTFTPKFVSPFISKYI